MKIIKEFWKNLVGFFSDEENPDEPIYDPAHLAGVIVVVIFSIGVLFWLLWTLLVFGGGIFGKIVPAFEVLFTKKTLADFGWLGYPYEQGIFEGFVGNIIALILTIALMTGFWWLFEGTQSPQEERDENSDAVSTEQNEENTPSNDSKAE